MADTKLTALTAVGAAPSGTDLLYISDGGSSKRITVDNLMKYLERELVIPNPFTPGVGEIFPFGWFPQQDITITKASLFALTAPTGAALVADILINDVAQTRLITLADGSTVQLTDITDLAVTAGQRVGLKFTQIGSTNPGNGISATLHYKKT